MKEKVHPGLKMHLSLCSVLIYSNKHPLEIQILLNLMSREKVHSLAVVDPSGISA